MKSSRFEILPKARFVTYQGQKVYKCYWVDPEDNLQHCGKPAVGVTYVGYGTTVDMAIQNCQFAYLQGRAKDNPPNFDHLLATSNLPWWKRLFRI